MSRKSFFALLLVVAGLTLTPAVAPVAGQNDTGQDAPTVEIDRNTTADPTTYAEEIDSKLRLVEWEYNDDREGFVLTYEADVSTRVTHTEAVQFEAGTGSGRIFSNRLPSGVSEIFIPVPRRAGQAAVTITTRRTIQQNRYAYVSTGQQEPDRPAIAYEKVRILVAISALGAAGATLRVVKRKRDAETKEAERLL